MAAVDWTTSRDDLVAALPSDPLHPLRVLGYEIKTRLEATGAVYDAIWSTEINNAKTIADAEYALDVSDNAALIESMAGYVDNACKVVEADQEAAQSGPSQYVGLSGKEAYSLASAVAVPWDGSGSATATAQLVLQDGATDVLTLVAKDAGAWGNTVEASVEVNAGGTTTVWTTGSGVAGTYSVSTAVAGTIIEYDLDATPKVTALRKIVPATTYLLVRRGDYSERYQLRAGKPLEDLKSSLLLASAEWSDAATEPDALGWTALAGGAGGSVDAIKTRAARAAKLSLGIARKSTIEALVAGLDRLLSATVPYPSDATAFPYAGRAVATEFEDAGTTYLAAGTNKGLNAALRPRQLSALQIEQRLLAIIDEAGVLHDLVV